jgi:hypothetical protein
MNFTHIDSALGTCYQGEVIASLDDLVETFGPPRDGVDHKTRAEWWLRFDDGCVATIYDWKRPELLADVSVWNVGGQSPHGLEHVKEALAS